jgi:hypothetical protein
MTRSQTKNARYRRRRYSRDADYRLGRINAWRAKVGKPLLSSPQEIGLDYSAVARQKARGPDGRFL